MLRGVSRLIVLSGAIISAGCAPTGKHPSKHHRVASVKSFTEATPVYRVISAPPYAFAATASGLDQWDLRSGRRIDATREGQLFTARIADIAYDVERKTLWFVGTDGIARYDLVSDKVTVLQEPPIPGRGSDLADGLARAVLSPGRDGGLYLGVGNSLFHADADGAWTETVLEAPISALHSDGPEGETVFVGTSSGLFAVREQTAVAIACELAAIRQLVAAPGGGVLAVGVADAGAGRVAHYQDGRCETFRPSPEARWLDIATDGDRAIVLTRQRVYELRAEDPALAERGDKMKRLTRKGMSLVSTDRLPSSSPFSIRRLDASVPPGAQTVAVSGGELLIGTRNLGTARLAIDGPRSSGDSRWLRREELAEHAALLSVACRDHSDCRLANGSGEVWGFDGERFSRRGSAGNAENSELGLVRVGDRVVSVVRRGQLPIVDIASAVGDGSGTLPGHPLGSLRVPPSFVLSVLREGPTGSVLLGWRAHGDGPDSPLSLVHWVSASGASKSVGSGGTPILDVVGCDNRIYVGSTAGVFDVTDSVGAGKGTTARTNIGAPLKGSTITEVSTDGSQHLECDRQQLVIATDDALLRLVGAEWTTALELTRPVRDFTVAADGRIFIADEAGLGIWDGDRIRRYDVHRGLLENDLREITLDRFGRIWIRGASSVGLFRL